MSKFKPAVDLWSLTDSGLVEAKAPITFLKPGQWVTAGKLLADRSNLGVFCGVKPSGTIVVAWLGNARSRPSYREYVAALMSYAKVQS